MITVPTLGGSCGCSWCCGCVPVLGVVLVVVVVAVVMVVMVVVVVVVVVMNGIVVGNERIKMEGCEDGCCDDEWLGRWWHGGNGYRACKRQLGGPLGDRGKGRLGG